MEDLEIPAKDSEGRLLCPRDNSPLVAKKSEHYMGNEFIGAFDSKACEFCNYYLLTASGYANSLIEASKFGLIGPIEEIIDEISEIVEIKYSSQFIKESTNIQNWLGIFVHNEGGNEEESNSSSNQALQPYELLLQPNIAKSQLSKKQKSFIRYK